MNNYSKYEENFIPEIKFGAREFLENLSKNYEIKIYYNQRTAEGKIMNKTKDSNQNIAKIILKVRQDNKISQEQFAEILGVTRQAVSRWEMGISVPNINTLILISKKFNISIDTMLKDTGTIIEQSEKNNNLSTKKNINFSFISLSIGFSGLISLPFLAEWQQTKNMELFKTAYEHSYDYILEYPLSIILVLALLFIGWGIYSIIKEAN